MGNDVPILWFLDPGFLTFFAICAVIYGAWWLVRGRHE